MPSLRRLEVFVAVVQQGGVAEAARRLRIAQSAVSMELHRLQQEIGSPLFASGPSRWSLSAAGHAIYRHALEILGATERLDHTIRGLQTGVEGTLRIGVSTSVGESLLLQPIKAFREHYPRVSIQVRVGNSQHVLQELLDGAVELVILGETVERPHVWCLPFHKDRIVIVASPRHALAAMNPVPPALLAEQSWISRELGSATRAHLEQCLHAVNIAPDYQIELGSNEAVKLAVRAGLGVAGLSAHVVAPDIAQGTLTVLPVTAWDCARWFCLGGRDHVPLSPPAEEFLRLAQRLPLED